MAVGSRVGASRSKSGSSLAESFPLSVVVPAGNAESTLGRCLEALLRNDPENVEILVVDDASSDGTARLASSFGERVELLALSRRRGPGGARNAGAAKARHPWILFVDADVVLPSRAVACIRETLDLYRHRPEVAGVLGEYSERIPWDDFLTQYKNLYTCYLYSRTETRSPFLHSAVLCIRRAVFEEQGGFQEGLATGEDFLLGTRLGVRGYRLIIDRRVRGIHLKRYRLGGLLKEVRRRVRDLYSLNLEGEERRFARKAHRADRLVSVALPGPALGLTAVSPFLGIEVFLAGLLLVGVFLACQSGFLAYCRHRRGLLFSLGCAGFVFLEMLWAQAVLAFALIRPRRGGVERGLSAGNASGSEGPSEG